MCLSGQFGGVSYKFFLKIYYVKLTPQIINLISLAKKKISYLTNFIQVPYYMYNKEINNKSFSFESHYKNTKHNSYSFLYTVIY